MPGTTANMRPSAPAPRSAAAAPLTLSSTADWVRPKATFSGASSCLREKGVRLAQQMQVGLRFPVGMQL
jgi:hypothetical protein